MVHLYIFCQLIKIMLSSNRTLHANVNSLRVFLSIFLKWIGLVMPKGNLSQIITVSESTIYKPVCVCCMVCNVVDITNKLWWKISEEYWKFLLHMTYWPSFKSGNLSRIPGKWYWFLKSSQRWFLSKDEIEQCVSVSLFKTMTRRV